MKNTLRIMALVLAVLMMLPIIASCGGDDTPEKPVVTTTGNLDYVSKLSHKDWTGETYRVIGKSSDSQGFNNFEIAVDGMTGDVVGDAVWTRNEILYQTYGFTVEKTLVPDVAAEVGEILESQIDRYDLMLYKPWQVFNLAQKGYFLDLNELPYLDFDHPTWNQSINAALTVGDKLFFTANNFLLQDKARTNLMFFNREMARANSYGELEDHVTNNTWTLETFSAIVKEMSYDIDGGGAGGRNDHFGIAADDFGGFYAMLVGAGFSISTNNNGVISINDCDKAMENIVTEVAKFAFDKTQVLYSGKIEPANWEDAENAFGEGLALFHTSFPSNFGAISNKCQFEYGILPFPKFNAAQERYYNNFNAGNSTVLTVPYTVEAVEGGLDKAAYMLEAISEASLTTTYPAYIEDKCKLQDAYDEVAAEMLDLCFQSVHYDVCDILDPNGIYTLIVTDMGSQMRADRFKRFYDSKYDNACDELDAIIDNFNFA